ncbi:MAG: ribonuclease III domain-containing protein [Methanomassiliicoccales archaeon]|jgi:ribonuclease-3
MQGEGNVDERLIGLQEDLGHKFDDIGLLETALRHRSMGSDNNERLEYLGDSVLSYVVSKRLFIEDANATEATLTRTRSVLTDRTTLKRIAERLGLIDIVKIGDSLRGKSSQKMLSDVVEAIIGAAFIDGGIEAAEHVIDRVVFAEDVVREAMERQDWISMVKEWCDQERVLLKYVTFEIDMGDQKAFQAWLTVGTTTESGTGDNKKEAMAAAAKKMASRLAP